jgi:hypothetical protein
MSNAVSVQLVNFERLQEVADRYPQVSEKYVGQAIQRSLLRVMGSAKREAPMGVTGFLVNKWSVKMGRFTGSLVSDSEHAVYVHNGTKPHWAPIDPLAKWAQRKGLNPYAVRNSIAMKGTRANPFLRRAVDKEVENIDNEMDMGIKQILANI